MASQTRVASATDPASNGTTGGASAPTKPRRTRSEIGKSNNRKGKDRELRVVKYLQVSGFPGAERMVRTGYRSTNRTSRDCGDITGTPGIAWQVKELAEQKWSKIPAILAETAAQAKAAQADFGVLVIRRPGHAHAGEWWAHMYCCDLFGLAAPVNERTRHWFRFPIRFELQELIPLLRVAGYGTPPDESADNEVSA